MITAAEFREAMRQWPTGVAIVTSYDRSGKPEGMTVNSLVSVSLDPPLLLVSLMKGSRTLEAVEDSRVFAVSVLSSRDEQLCWTFARNQQERSFEGFGSDHNLPVVQDAVVKLVCGVEQLIPVADHVLVIGRAMASGGEVDGSQPLVFCSGSLRELGAHEDQGEDEILDLFGGW